MIPTINVCGGLGKPVTSLQATNGPKATSEGEYSDLPPPHPAEQPCVVNALSISDEMNIESQALS